MTLMNDRDAGKKDGLKNISSQALRVSTYDLSWNKVSFQGHYLILNRLMTIPPDGMHIY